MYNVDLVFLFALLQKMRTKKRYAVRSLVLTK